MNKSKIEEVQYVAHDSYGYHAGSFKRLDEALELEPRIASAVATLLECDPGGTIRVIHSNGRITYVKLECFEKEMEKHEKLERGIELT